MDFGDNLKEDPVKPSGDSSTTSPKKSEIPLPDKHEEELMRQFAQKDSEISNLIGMSASQHIDYEDQRTFELLEAQSMEYTRDSTTTSKSSTSEVRTFEGGTFETSNLLGDIQGQHGTADAASKTDSKDLKNAPAAGGDTQAHLTQGHSDQVGYFERVSPNMMEFGIDQVSPPRSPYTERVGQQQEITGYPGIHEYHSASTLIGSSVPLSSVDNFHGTQSEPFFQHEHEQLVPRPTAFGMTSSLDEIQQPEFYESGDSSYSNKESDGANKPKSATDSQILEPDDLNEYLPKDPVENFSSSTTIEPTSTSFESQFAESHASSSYTDSLAGFAVSSVDSSPTSKKDDTKLNEQFPVPEFVVAAEPVPDANSSPFDFYTKEPMIISDESPNEEEFTISSKDELLFEAPAKVEEKVPSPLPGYQLQDDYMREFEAKHSELTNFLQERDPSSGVDDFDRSEDSISPNPVVGSNLEQQSHHVDDFGSNTGFDYGKQSPDIFNEPIMESVKVGISEAKASGYDSKHTTPFEHVEFEKKSTPEPSDLGFEVIAPPAVPPHKGDLGPQLAGEFSEPFDAIEPEEPIIAVCPPGPKPTNDLYEIEQPVGLPSRKSPEPKEKSQESPSKTLEDHELDEFLPRESFEKIPSTYTTPVKEVIVPRDDTPPPVPPHATKIEPKSQVKPVEPIPKSAPKKPAATRPRWEGTVDISEDAQLILNILNPKAWFDPNKLHPTVSELVYWRDPKKSGIVFGTAFVILLALAFLSFISVVAYTSLAVLAGTFAFRVYKNVLQAVQKTQDGHPFKQYLEMDLALEGDKAQEVCSAIISHLNQRVIQLRRLFLVEDLVDSAKFGAFLYFLTYLGAWFNGLTLVILGLVALFALPKVYETNKNVIDQYLDLAWAKISEINSKVTAALPFGKKDKAQ